MSTPHPMRADGVARQWVALGNEFSRHPIADRGTGVAVSALRRVAGAIASTQAPAADLGRLPRALDARALDQAVVTAPISPATRL